MPAQPTGEKHVIPAYTLGSSQSVNADRYFPVSDLRQTLFTDVSQVNTLSMELGQNFDSRFKETHRQLEHNQKLV